VAVGVERRRIRAFGLRLDGDVAAVARVAPAVVLADVDAAAAARLVADERALVAARVVERAQRAVAAAHDDERLAAHRERHEVVRRRHLAGVADEHPAALEEGRHLAREHVGIAEGIAVDAKDAVAGTVVDECGEVCRVAHGDRHARPCRRPPVAATSGADSFA